MLVRRLFNSTVNKIPTFNKIRVQRFSDQKNDDELIKALMNITHALAGINFTLIGISFVIAFKK
jgi:hypothetical protein